MDPHKILALDRFVGTPACIVFSAIEKLLRLVVRRPTAPPRRILFVKLIEMGSTVLACPAFQEATRLVGRENLFFLVFKQNRPIVDLLPYFPPDNVIMIDDSTVATFISGLWSAMRRVRREKIDAAIDMEGLTRSSAIITWLMGTPTRVGYYNFTAEGPYRGRLFTHEINYNFQHHVSRMFLALVRALQAPPDQVPRIKELIPQEKLTLPSFVPSSREADEVITLIAERCEGQRPGRIVLLNPNCGDLLPLRRWPTEKFIELGRQLLSRCPDVTVVITGAPGERETAERITVAIGPRARVVSLAGHTTLRQLLSLYCLSRLLVSNDSGPCHFASLTPIHVIALFGPETPLLYSPLGPRIRCITANLACSPCVNMLNHRFSPCTDNVCMKSIPVSLVLDTALQILSS